MVLRGRIRLAERDDHNDVRLMQPDGQLVEQIVSGVLERLRGSSVDRPPSARGSAKATDPIENPAGGSNSFVLGEKVITGQLLEEKANGAREIVVGSSSVLTPSAHEFLRRKQIAWSRGELKQKGGSAGSSSRWKSLILQATAGVDAAVDELARTAGAQWERELVGSVPEAVEKSVSAICRGESSGVVVFAEAADAVACLANRNDRVRAAAVVDVPHVQRVRQSMGANLFAIRPGGRGYFELRNLLRAVNDGGGMPQRPAEWREG